MRRRRASLNALICGGHWLTDGRSRGHRRTAGRRIDDGTFLTIIREQIWCKAATLFMIIYLIYLFGFLERHALCGVSDHSRPPTAQRCSLCSRPLSGENVSIGARSYFYLTGRQKKRGKTNVEKVRLDKIYGIFRNFWSGREKKTDEGKIKSINESCTDINILADTDNLV